MITLQRLVEAQNKMAKKEKTIGRLMGITIAIGVATFVTTMLFNFSFLPLLFVVFVFAGLIICSYANLAKLYSTSQDIAESVGRILDASVERNLTENEVVLISCEKNTDYHLYFLVEVYANNISYEDLVAFVEPVVYEINKIISPELYVYYRIERDDEYT